MKVYQIKAPKDKIVKGEVTLNGSKSISNRVLIIKSLCKGNVNIDNLSNADDTVTLKNLLDSNSSYLDAGAGGTTYRFLTAYLATQENREVILTGSERMQKRPIRVLVDALRELGADISYEKEEGYPPLKIKGKKLEGGKISIPASTSSQFITALLLIAPQLENGLQLELVGEIVSLPYIQMTLKLMKYFGISTLFEKNIITIWSSEYQARDFFVEADWSAASYYYSIVFLADEAQIQLNGLSQESTQGDAVIADIFAPFVKTEYKDHRIFLSKRENTLPDTFEYDFIECPDLAQTVIVALAAKKINTQLKGLKTLLIKETDRVAALDTELGKYGVRLKGSVAENHWFLQAETFNKDVFPLPQISTYEDHRMAMSIAPLSLITNEILIAEPDVVSKSYPLFWEDLKRLGMIVG
ncbi:MAG: hypothetical protein M9887_08945 [Chitinophagales bacterium]|nr:hypothetical protein [Chitinophagales bacterium]